MPSDFPVDPTPSEPSCGEVHPQRSQVHPTDIVESNTKVILQAVRDLGGEVSALRDEVRDFANRERRDERAMHQQLREIAANLRRNPDDLDASLTALEALIPELDAIATRTTPVQN